MAFIKACGGGNPYLRYDADNDQIQAMDEDGTWINIYPTDQLPLLADLYLYELPNFITSSYELKREVTGSGSNHKLGSGVLFKNVDVTSYNKLYVETAQAISSTNWETNIFVSNNTNTSIIYDNATVLAGIRRNMQTPIAQLDISSLSGVCSIAVAGWQGSTSSDSADTATNTSNGIYCKTYATACYIKNVWLTR